MQHKISLTFSFKDKQVVCALEKDTMNAKLGPMGKGLLHIPHLIIYRKSKPYYIKSYFLRFHSPTPAAAAVVCSPVFFISSFTYSSKRACCRGLNTLLMLKREIKCVNNTYELPHDDNTIQKRIMEKGTHVGTETRKCTY